MIEVSSGSCVEFDYVNWKGENGHRKVMFRRLLFGSNEYHPEKQLLIEAFDIQKDANRTFAVKDISNLKYW